MTESIINNYKFRAIGTDVVIDSCAVFKRAHLVAIGSHCAFDYGMYMTCGGSFGNYNHVGPHVSIIGGSDGFLEMKDFANIAAGARIICLGDQHLGEGLPGPLIPNEYRDELVGGKITIGRMAHILTNAVILPGVSISEGSVVGAGCIISRDTEPWAIYMGNPARIIKYRDRSKMVRYAEALETGL